MNPIAQGQANANPFATYVSAQASQRMDARFSTIGNYEPTDAEQDALYQIAIRYNPDSRDMNGYAQHRQWWVNLAFYAGLQYVRWNDTIGGLEISQGPRWRRRHVANRILPMVQRNYAKLVSDSVDLRAVPVSPDRNDISSARLAERFLSHARYVSQWEETRDDAILWSLITGSGFQKLTWDATAGPKLTILKGDEQRQIQAGDMAWDAPTPFSIRVPLQAVELENMPWIVQESVVPWEWILERYPEKAHYIVPFADYGQENIVERRIKQIVGLFGTAASVNQADGSKGFCKVVELWTRPCEGYSKGLHVIASQGVCLSAPGPNPWGEVKIWLPFLHRRYTKIPGRFFGMGLVEQLISPQQEYNSIRSIISENMVLTSRPKWLAPKGAGIPKAAFTSEPGEIIEYNSAFPKPEPAAVPPLAPYVVEHAQACIVEMNDIAAQQDPTQAKSPASVRSGIQVQLLQQADLAVIAMPRKLNRSADRRGADMMVFLASKNYTEPRFLSVLGEEEEYSLQSFLGSDLEGFSSFRIYPESGLLDSKAARQQSVLDIVELGVINPADPKQQTALLKMLEIGDTQQFVQDTLADERFAEIENDIFSRSAGDKNGPPMFWTARDFDDHLTHILRHNIFRKSLAYTKLEDAQREAFDEHVQSHQLMLMEQMAAQGTSDQGEKDGEDDDGEKGEPSPPKRGGQQGGGGGRGGNSGASRNQGPAGKPSASG